MNWAPAARDSGRRVGKTRLKPCVPLPVRAGQTYGGARLRRHVTVVSVNETKASGPRTARAHRSGNRAEASRSSEAFGDARSDEAGGEVYSLRRKLRAELLGGIVLGLPALENQRVARFRSAKRSGVTSARS